MAIKKTDFFRACTKKLVRFPPKTGIKIRSNSAPMASRPIPRADPPAFAGA